MELKRLKIEENGSVEATWLLNQQQFQLLLNYAIDSLLSRGLITTIDITEDELKELHKQAEAEAATDMLSKLDASQLGQA